MVPLEDDPFTDSDPAHMTSRSTAPRAQLCIWTGIDPAHEADFNRWYDREHMQERMAIAGFQSARRFRAVDSQASRPYLALYTTDDLQVFRSESYQRAFLQQTEWSRRNFDRMRNTQRRVGELVVEHGEGEGGFVALFVVPPQQIDRSRIASRLAAVTDQDHIVHAALLQTDAQLSTPLTAGAVPAAADALVMIEASVQQAAAVQAQALSAELGAAPDGVHVFQLLWRLGASNAIQP